MGLTITNQVITRKRPSYCVQVMKGCHTEMQASVSSHNILNLCSILQNLCGNIQIDSFFAY